MPVPRCRTVLRFLAVAWAAVVSATAAEDLLRNPGFEQADAAGARPVGWAQPAAEAPAQWLTDGAHGGKAYVRLVDTGAAGVSLESERLPARPGGQYRAAAWTRVADKGQPGVYINFYDDTGLRVHHVYVRRAVPGPDWERLEATATAPPEAETVSVLCYSYGADVGTYDFDDAELTVNGGGEPGSAGIPHAQPGGQDMVDIGSRLELFVDGLVVDSLSGRAERRLHRPEMRDVALTFDRPWEGRYAAYVSVVTDGDRVRLYYRGWPDLKQPDCCCVAESTDGGLSFTRPSLGLYEFAGSRDNNIVWAGPGSHNFTPFRDANPAAPPAQRYKALASAGPKASLVAFVSADGYRWTRLRDEPVLTDGAFDSQNLAFWDPVHHQYVAFYRDFHNGVRDIKRAVSDDFLTWTPGEWLDYGQALPEHLYTNAIAPYPRAPHLLLGFPCRFAESRRKLADHPDVGVNDGVLMSSRDGRHWDRWPEAFLRPSLDPLCWTDRNNYIAWGLASTSASELSLYANEHYDDPSQRLRRYAIRTDGFASVAAGAHGGELLTRRLRFAGHELVLNYQTSAVGSVRVELCDDTGAALPGFALADHKPLFGNEIAAVVTWTAGADIKPLAGRPVRLRVQLRDADLYSFQFR